MQIKIRCFFFLQVTTRVFLVWAYHLVDDASDARDFSMHSRRGHTSESYRLVYENKSSNISKTTATNQCKRVPDLRRPGSVRIKRYCAKTVD